MERKAGNWSEGGTSINGESYGKSLYDDLGGCNLDSSVEYVLGRDWESVAVTIGLSDDSDRDSSALFEIFADDRLIYGKELGYGDDRTVKRSVKGVLNLRLAVTLRDGKRGMCGDTNYPAWGDPKLTRM